MAAPDHLNSHQFTEHAHTSGMGDTEFAQHISTAHLGSGLEGLSSRPVQERAHQEHHDVDRLGGGPHTHRAPGPALRGTALRDEVLKSWEGGPQIPQPTNNRSMMRGHV